MEESRAHEQMLWWEEGSFCISCEPVGDCMVRQLVEVAADGADVSGHSATLIRSAIGRSDARVFQCAMAGGPAYRKG